MAVLYTTHYMEEAERLCDRVGIIDAGQLMAEGTRDELVRELGREDHCDVPGQRRAASAHRLAGGSLGDSRGDRCAGSTGWAGRGRPATAPALIAPAVQAAQARGVDVMGVDVGEPDLEAVFLHLTGKALRD